MVTSKKPEFTSNPLQRWQSEWDSVDSVLDGLRTSVPAEPDEADFGRQATHARFVVETVHQLLIKMFDKEESEHQSELLRHPEFQHRVAELRNEHQEIRSELARLGKQLEQTCGGTSAIANEVRGDVGRLVDKIKLHMHNEIQLIQDGWESDTGGEA